MPRNSQEDTFNDQLPADKGKKGILQRLALEVKKPYAMFVMGERYKPEAAAGEESESQKEEREKRTFGYRGFSLKSMLHFFADIDLKTLFQGHDNVTLQTDKQLTAYSTGRTVVHAADRAEVGSAKLTMVSQFVAKDHDPPVGAHMQEVTGESDGDELPDVASFTDARDHLLQDLDDNDASKWKDQSGTIKGAYAQIGHTYDDGAKTKYTELSTTLGDAQTDKALTGLALVSENQLTVAAVDKTLAYLKGHTSAFIGSPATPSDLNVHVGNNAQLNALAEIRAHAETNAVLTSTKSTEVSSHGPCLMSSHTGKATIIAPTIQIGGHDPAGRLGDFTWDTGTQKKTDLVSIESQEINADAEKKVIVKSKDKIEVTGTNKCTIKVGDYSVELTTSKITVKAGAAGLTLMELKDGEIKINDVMATATFKRGSGVKVEAGPHAMECAPSGFKVTGMMISLG